MKKKLSFRLLGMPYEATVALSYFVIAVLWIVFSDRVLAKLVHDPKQFIVLSSYKGGVYACFTGLLLYIVLHRIFVHIRLGQKELSESEARYRLLVENQADLVIKTDLEGRFLFASPSCCELFGRPEEVLLEQTFMTLVHEGDQTSIQQAWKALFKPPHKAYVEQRTVTTAGLRWLAWKYTGLLDGNGAVEFVVGVGRDITEKKESEDAIRESEAKLSEAQHIARIGRWDMDFVSTVFEMSDEIYALLEVTREDYTPSYETLFSFVHPDDREWLDQAFQRAREKKTAYQSEHRVLMPDGRIKWVSALGKFEYDDLGEPFRAFGTVQDITEKKESEDAIRESEAKLIEAQQIARIGRWDIDFASTSLEWSDEIYSLLEIRREDYTPSYETLFSFVHPDDRVRLDQAFQRAREKKTDYQLEHRVLMPDGRMRWFNERGKFEYDDLGEPFRAFGTVQDITERKLAEQALQESQSNFEAITNQSTLGITMADVDGNYTLVNPAFCKMIGYSNQELLQMSVFDVIEKEQDPNTFNRTKTSEEGQPVQMLLERKDGVKFTAEVVGKVLVVSGEKCVLGIISDITERKQVEDALRESESKYRELAENTAAILWEYDVTQDRWTYVAPQVEQILGYAPEEWTDFEFWASRLHEDDRDWVVTYCGDCSARGESHDFEYRFRKKDGEVIWLRDIVDVEMKAEAALVLRGLMIDITERKQGEIKLRQAQHQLEATLDAIPDLIFELGLDSFIYDFHSPRTELFFLPPENFMGKKMTEVLPAEASASVTEALMEAHEQGRSSEKQYSLRLEQGVRWFEISISSKPPAENQAPRFIAISRDITQRKQTEGELEKQHELLRKSQRIAHVGSWELDVASHSLSWSEEVYRIFGVEPQGFNGSYEAFLEIVHPDDREKVNLGFVNSLEDGSSGYEVEHRIIHQKTGELRFVHEKCDHTRDESGKVVHSVGMAQDITERKQAVEEKERLLTAINQAAETVMITDVAGTIQYVNPAFEKLSGYTREEALGKTPRILKSDRQDAACYQELWNTISSGKNWAGRLVNKRKDGSFYTEDMAISPVKDAAGKIVNYVAINMDVTAELLLEQQLRQTQKMESIGRLASGVAYDFNTILQTITGFCGLLLSDLDRDSIQWSDVTEIKQAAGLGGDLTRQLLSFSRNRASEFSWVNLNTVLSEGSKMLQHALDESFQLNFKLESTLKVKADAPQILQMVMNLILNAREAMPDGGPITLCTQNLEIKGKDFPGRPRSRVGTFVRFSVTDRGCGMDEKQLAHIYEPFYTTKKIGKGAGLGLSVVYGIVEEHGGWIEVESAPGKGTAIQICLPTHDDSESEEGEISYNTLIGKRVLLVEVDGVVRELTAEILQNLGYAVSVAADAAEAECLFSAKNGAFDLLFSAILLPDRNGVDLAEGLLKQKPELAVLMSGGLCDEVDQRDLIREKGFRYIQKPFNLNRLLNEMDQSVNR